MAHVMQQDIGSAIGRSLSSCEITKRDRARRTCFTKRNKISGVLHGDDFVVTGSMGHSLSPRTSWQECIQSKQKPTVVVQNIEQKGTLGRGRSG